MKKPGHFWTHVAIIGTLISLAICVVAIGTHTFWLAMVGVVVSVASAAIKLTWQKQFRLELLDVAMEEYQKRKTDA